LEKPRLSASTAPVVTRFAPSPTGFLHIGGARTALFNWLYARHHDGRFLLRIEDTDKARSTQAAIDAIIEGMRWLELEWDGETWFRPAQPIATPKWRTSCWPRTRRQMLCDASGVGGDARRPARGQAAAALWTVAGAIGHAARSRRARLCRPPEGATRGETVIEDAVQGGCRQNSELDDMILLRSDGTPTYMLAVVVDDHDMGVTHVIRGDDHLNNAFRQLGIIKAMAGRSPSMPTCR
jgi:glutamyl-tRNA synthetase